MVACLWGACLSGTLTGAGQLFSESFEVSSQASAFCSRSSLFQGSGGSLRYPHLSGMSLGGQGDTTWDALLHGETQESLPYTFIEFLS